MAMANKIQHAQVQLLNGKSEEELGFIRPTTYGLGKFELARFMKRMRTKKERGELLEEGEVRRLWAGTFRNNHLAECAESNRILRAQVEVSLRIGSTRFLNHAMETGWKFAFDGYRTEWSSLDTYEFLKDKASSPLLRFGEQETMIIVNMVSGIAVAPLVIEALTALGRQPAGFALTGYSKRGHTQFEDLTPMTGQFYVHPVELRRLKRHVAKKALVIDDCKASGESFQAVACALHEIGFGDVYTLDVATGEIS